MIFWMEIASRGDCVCGEDPGAVFMTTHVLMVLQPLLFNCLSNGETYLSNEIYARCISLDFSWLREHQSWV